jgi:hypothetical protein
MSRKNLLMTAVAAAALAAILSAPAVSNDDHDGGRRLKATLSGYNEILQTLSTPARGSFSGRISRDGDEIAWRLEYKDIPTSVTQAHIHFGDHHTNGGISVFLCSNLGNGPAGTQACPNGPGTNVVTGTSIAADVVGPAGQGIAAGEFEEFVKAIRAGRTYANVHTMQFGGGEIRGQIKVED